VVIWYIFSRIGIFYQKKSGNPAVGPFFARRSVNIWQKNDLICAAAKTGDIVD
jgi:hypothetical protein